MSFPADMDFDRIMLELLGSIDVALKGWKKGGLLSEEPLMNRIVEPFNRNRRGCDVGAATPLSMTSQVAILHRRGANQTDAFGSDLAITIDIPSRAFRKTALFQLKVANGLSASIERSQINAAHAHPLVQDRSFVMVTDRERLRTRVKSTRDLINAFRPGAETATCDCSPWLSLGQWASQWLSCEVGVPSGYADPNGVEGLLERFIVEQPDEWVSPFGETAQTTDLPERWIPAKVWLVLRFAPPPSAERTQ